MKPFNLKEALAGAPVITRDGREAIQLKFFEDVNINLVVGVVSKNIWSWNIDGQFDSLRGDNSLDLFMAEVEKSQWVNIWETRNGYILTTNHNREDQADLEIENELVHKHLKKIRITL